MRFAMARAVGEDVPEGLRNSWLHLVATCLTHQHENLESPYCLAHAFILV